MPIKVAAGGLFDPGEDDSGGRWTQFDHNFVGAASIPCAYKLDLLQDCIEVSFLSQNEPFTDTTVKPGFFEGLWRFDCGELWLANPESGRYIEFNLAPTGDWWTCVFVSPRVRDFETDPPQCVTEGYRNKSAWFAKLKISRTEVERCIGNSENLIGNVTLVLGGCDHPDERLENLHSIVPLGAVDFHRPQDWVPLSNLI